jgi:acyl-CoA reductase-like NAD-dependent aldehyde dehydrogenase
VKISVDAGSKLIYLALMQALKVGHIVFKQTTLKQHRAEATTSLLITSFFNSGQIGTPSSRLLRAEERVKEFIETFKRRSEEITVAIRWPRGLGWFGWFSKSNATACGDTFRHAKPHWGRRC